MFRYDLSPIVLLTLWTFSCSKTPEEPPSAAVHHVSTDTPPRPPDTPSQKRVPSDDDIHYTIGFDDAIHHYISVRAEFPAAPDRTIELRMAVWTPGSYLVRDYSRHLEGLRVVDSTGSTLQATKIRKNRWQIHTGNQKGVVVEYKIYCRELSVRTNFVNADSAIINGAATFLTLADDTPHAHHVHLELPGTYRQAISPMESDTPNHFRAADYDELVDSPILAGRELAIGEFTINKVRHRLAHLGDSSQWDLAETLRDVEQITRAGFRFWGVMPYKHYDFLNAILGGRGGLEHADSTLLMSNRFNTKPREEYRRWLGLVTHEFFHTWNGKRLRPTSLGPFDYDNENYTESLWIVEGITTYYANLLLRRSGLLTEEQFLDVLSKKIQSVETTPGRNVQSLAHASYDAWIKHYKKNENSDNTSISYYTKGAVVAFLLDVEIRRATSGNKSLDDLMRAFYASYSADQGYTPESFRTLANKIAGTDLKHFFDHTVDSTRELDYTAAHEYFGLHFNNPDGQDDKRQNRSKSNDKIDDQDLPPGWLGLTMENTTVATVKTGTPGYKSGFNVGDEIIAVNSYRVTDLDSLLTKFPPGQTTTFTISRLGKLRTLSVELGEKPTADWQLAVKSNQKSQQARRYREWIAPYPDIQKKASTVQKPLPIKGKAGRTINNENQRNKIDTRGPQRDNPSHNGRLWK